MLALLGLLVLFAAFFSAVLLILTSFARSFKEAQAYLIPLMLASLGPGLAGMIPGLTLDGTLAVTPLVNIVLLARDVFENKATPAGGHPGGVVDADLRPGRHRRGRPDLRGRGGAVQRTDGLDRFFSPAPENSAHGDDQQRPGVPGPDGADQLPDARALPHQFGGTQRGGMLIFMSLGSILLFIVLPGLAAYWGRVDWREGFSLQPASWLALAGGVILGLTLWPIGAADSLLDSARSVRGGARSRWRRLAQSAGWCWFCRWHWGPWRRNCSSAAISSPPCRNRSNR